MVQKGRWLIVLMMFAMLMTSAFATVTINDLDFPDKIGSSFSGNGILDFSTNTDDDLLVKSAWYKNGLEYQQDSYLSWNTKEFTNYFYESYPGSYGLAFNDHFVLTGNDVATPGTSQAKIYTKDGLFVRAINETNGLDCRYAEYDNETDIVYIGCNTAAKALHLINGTSLEYIRMYNSTTSAIYAGAVHDIAIHGDYMWLGSSNRGSLMNKSNMSQKFEDFTTNGAQYGYFNKETNKLYVAVASTKALWEYNIATDTKFNYYNAGDNWLGNYFIPYMFSTDNRLIIASLSSNQSQQAIHVYNMSNMSQGRIDYKTFSRVTASYNYQRRTNDPNMLWFFAYAVDPVWSYSITGLDRDLNLVIVPTYQGTKGPQIMDAANNEIYIMSNPIRKMEPYTFLNSDSTINTKYFWVGNLSVGDNLTLVTSIFNIDTGDKTTFNKTAQVYNNSINLEFPLSKLVIQRHDDGKGKLNVYGTYDGEDIDSFNMTYEGPDTGVLTINVNATNGFYETINLTQGDYILTFRYNDIILANNPEFGVGDVLIVHGQSNAANTNNGGVQVPKSPYGVYKSLKTENLACTNADYRLSEMETSNRWAEVAHQLSINQSVPVIVHNFAIGGAKIAVLHYTCGPYNMQTINAVTGGTNDIRGVVMYHGESDNSDPWELYYEKLGNMSTYYFDNLNFPLGEFFSAGQVLTTPVNSPTLTNATSRSQQEAWHTMDNLYYGGVTYDIELTPPGTNPHPTELSKKIFEQRNNRGPLYSLAGLYARAPVLQNMYYYNESRLILEYDNNNLEISEWDETEGTIPEGILFSGLNLNSSNITNAEIRDNLVIIDYDGAVLNNESTMTMCNYAILCYGQPVIRESVWKTPAEIIWEGKGFTTDAEFNCNFDGLVWDNNQCNSMKVATNVPEGRSIKSKSGNHDVSSYGYYGDVDVVFKKGDVVVGEGNLNITEDLDMSNLTIDSDATRSVFHVPTELDSLITNKSLYIPAKYNTGEVYICPGAESLNDVSLSCDNIEYYNLTSSNGFYIFSITGTGGGEISPDAPTASVAACNTISEQIFESFNIGVIALILLVATLIIGTLMSAFGGNFDGKALMATVTMVIMMGIFFIIGIVLIGIIQGKLC